MKLSQLTPEQKTRLLAELDGWQVHPSKINPLWDKFVKFICGVEETRNLETLPPYLTSYDAIIPLVQKFSANQLEVFMEQLCAMLGEKFNPNDRPLGKLCVTPFQAIPSQLSDAVLIATGKAEI